MILDINGSIVKGVCDFKESGFIDVNNLALNVIFISLEQVMHLIKR
jgi:hypothetical protein